MKINSKRLFEAVRNCLKIAGTPSEPILTMIRIIGRKGSIKLTVTNLEELYSAVVPVKDGFQFDTMVNAEQMFRVMKNIRDRELDIGYIHNSDLEQYSVLTINAGMKFKLQANDTVEHFPEGLKVFRKGSHLKINDQKVFLELLKKVSFSTTKAKVNKAYSGILVSKQKGHTELVTTDIHRLTIARTGVVSTPYDFVLPVDSMKNILKVFGTTAITKAVLLKENKGDPTELLLATDTESYITRLSKIEFPAYRNVLIPGIVDSSWFELDGSIFKRKLKTVSDFHSQEKVVAGAFSFSENNLHMISQGSDRTETEISMKIKPVNVHGKEPKMIGLNIRYLLDAVKALDISAVNFDSDKGLTPFYLTERTDAYRIYHLIMPLRIHEIKNKFKNAA